MPSLACWSCGRRIYSTDPLDELFTEERVCPRCGEMLNLERRDHDRRSWQRRQSASRTSVAPGRERRVVERRAGKNRRRRD